MLTPYKIFRIAAVAEAFSWAGLLIGMYLKRVTETTDLGVYIFGRVHGLLFVVYIAAAVWTARTERWSLLRTLVGLAASIPPFTSLIFERWVAKRRPDTEELTRPA
ncbi:DUF3817 domain-containing protein [Actinoplanes sp. CA-054009]